ncbi:glycoside hydrolase family 99-like domain-containing protein [Pseudomonas sp. 2FG]|uniref:glycoside hydrolase family 99-like domain-containing protein n=1 Tax=Pseudomonas sp. 2FG TaxID=2502191 RepID=UPI0010F5D030|nr:glycoside hydrolase family 99-like domain-containing protein [Pseudomonas sp. 2FG]
MAEVTKRIVVVLGMHRSGTSAITRGLQVLSLDLGDKLIGAIPGNNEKGFWEDAEINAFNEALLKKLDSAWHRLAKLDDQVLLRPEFSLERKTATALLQGKLSDNTVFAFKDPRVAILLPFWQNIFAQLDLKASYLIAIRNPLDVAQSLHKRDDFAQVKGLMLWAKHQVGALRGTHQQQRVFVTYDAMLEEPEEQLTRIARALELPPPQSAPQALREYTEEFLTPALRHNVAAHERLTDTQQVSPFIHELYQLLQQLAADSLPANGNALEQRWQAFEQRYLEFLPLLAHSDLLEKARDAATRERESALQQLAIAINTRDQAVNAQQTLAASHEQLFNELTSLRIQLEQLQIQHLAAEQALSKLAQEHAQVSASYEHSLSEKADLIDQLNAAQQAAQEEVARLTEALSELAQEHAQVSAAYQHSLSEKADLIDQLNAAQQAAQEEVARLTETLSELAQEHAQVSAAYEYSLSEKADLTDQLNAAQQAAQEEVARLTETLQHVKQLHTQSAQTAQQLQQQLAGTQAQLENLRQEQERLQEEKTGLIARQDETGKALHDTRLSVEKLNDTRDQLQQQVGHLQGQYAAEQHNVLHLSQQLAQTNAQLARIISSKSWFLTKPLRFLRRSMMTRPYRFIRRTFSNTAHAAWHQLPFSSEAKQRFKNTIFKSLPTVFRWTQAYRSWQNFTAPINHNPPACSAIATAPTQLQASASAEYIPLLQGAPLKSKPVKLICFYLPQFHPIAENNAWWGEGFTEWTNVQPAQPQFAGHYQPHVPAELGYYSLLDSAVQRRQTELAKLYGIEGFCFYFYWFGGKRLLETPIENYLKDASLDLPFCLCWANENWSRRWDGLDSEILIDQQHSPEDDLAFIAHVAQYMRDARYIRIDGKPLLLVYRPSLLPSAKETAERWRTWCRANGIGEIYLAYTQSFETVDPAKYGFDAAIEFPPNNSAPPNITNSVTPLNEDFGATVYDWRVFVERSEKYQQPDYKLFRSVCPAWDNTARRKNRSTVFLNSTPSLYRRWLENAIQDTEQRHDNPDEQLIFVNAWNEWAEGAHLEPDAHYGYAYLQATRDALSPADTNQDQSILLVTHDCHPHGAQFLILETAKQLKANGLRVVILALDGGKLLDDFAHVGRTLNAKEVGGQAVQTFLANLRAEGCADAITSTVVSGRVLPQLKALGFRVLSLIHELPGVIREMQQEVNAEAIAQHADKIVFPASLVHQRYCEITPVAVEKVVIRPQGVLRKNPYKTRRAEAHSKICKKHKLPADCQIILSIGYADSRKGADLFVEIAAQTLKVRPNSAFIWVGHAEQQMEKSVTQRIQQLGLEDRVLFTGFDREPLAYYAAAAAYALPSREDPFPNVVLESAEVGVPVVAFEGASGAGDFIQEQGGRLASYLDVQDFARQLCELLANPVEQPSRSVGSLQQYALDLLHHLNGFPRISVVVPNYNYERHIGKRLKSIYRQNWPIYELIVLDDASSDNSVEVIEKHLERSGSDGQLIVNQSNSGSVFRQWQKGLALSKGDLLWIAEADDLADSDFLDELAPAFHDPSVVLAYSQSKQIDDRGKVLAPNYLDYTKDISEHWLTHYVRDGREEIGEALSIKNTIPNVSAVLFRRTALERAFNAIGDDLFGYRVAGDWLIYLHALLQGKVYFCEKSLNQHRRHTNSVTSSTQELNHLQEVCKVQEIARELTEPSAAALAKAHAYIEHLHEHFQIPSKNGKGIRDGISQVI